MVYYGLDATNRGVVDDRCCFPAQSSVLDETALLERVVPEYLLPDPLACRFYDRGDFDLYQVLTAGPTYYLKLYRTPHPTARAEAEARLLVELASRGAHVVEVVPRQDGRYATEVSASEGPRPLLLFGSAPATPFALHDASACCELGLALAGLHAAADQVDLEPSAMPPLADPLPAAARLADPGDQAVLTSLREQLRERLSSLGEPSDPGWNHGAPAGSNLRRRPDGKLVFCNFGQAAHGPRAGELAQVWRSLQNDIDPAQMHRRWEAVLSGYAQVRSVPAEARDDEQLQLYSGLQRIEWIATTLAKDPLRMGTEVTNQAWVRRQVDDLRASVAELPPRREVLAG